MTAHCHTLRKKNVYLPIGRRDALRDIAKANPAAVILNIRPQCVRKINQSPKWNARTVITIDDITIQIQPAKITALIHSKGRTDLFLCQQPK